MDAPFDAELIFYVPEDERVEFMVDAYSKHGRSFVDHAFRPLLSFSLQHPKKSSIPSMLLQFLSEMDSSMRVVLMRIGLEELDRVLVVSHENDAASLDALETFLAICPMDVKTMGAFIERLSSVDMSKDVRKQLLHLVYFSTLSEDAKQEYFVHAAQMESTSLLREMALGYLQETDLSRPAALHAIVNQLRDKSKRVHMAAFGIVIKVHPEVLLQHLGVDKMAPCLAVLSQLANSNDDTHHVALGRMLVVYATHPTHTLAATCNRLVLLDKYRTEFLDALVCEQIDRLVLPSFFSQSL